MAATYAFTADAGPLPAIRKGPDGRRTAYGTIQFGSTYATGGTAISSALHPQVISSTADLKTVNVEVLDATDSTGIIWKYLPATGKLQAFWSTTGAGIALVEVTNGTALTGVLRVAISGQ
jgi:hypothetical protein